MISAEIAQKELDLSFAGHIIDGEQRDSADEQSIDVIAPRDRSVMGMAAQGGVADVEAAVKAARAAFPAWRDMAPRARGRLLARVADRLEDAAERIAKILSLENGNALRTQSRGELAFAVDTFRYFGGLASEAKGEQIPLSLNKLDYSRREPYGVVGAIIPWNAPVQLGCMKIAPSIAVGNTIVLKTAEDAPFAVMEIAKICQEFLPPGVVNVVHGTGAVTGEALINAPGVDKLSFTGSTAVGQRILAVAASRIIPASLELGGKNPQIVFPDADEEWAVEAAMLGMRFFRQGQSCTAGSRLFVHQSIFDSFMQKFSSKAAEMTVGDPLEEASDIGAIVNKKQFDRVCGFIEEAMSVDGGQLLAGGPPPKDGPLSLGYYARPTVFSHIDNSFKINRQEVFGPVVVAIPWETEDEVVAMANDTHYGLSAFVHTKDLGAAIRTAHRIDAGWVQVNHGGGQVLGQSYGGYKNSGMGREFSLEGMLEGYTHRKHISIRLDV
ncbi:MAG TPA: aldehyde dehydrogenase family protein [Microbacteriaceae bacterium]